MSVLRPKKVALHRWEKIVLISIFVGMALSEFWAMLYTGTTNEFPRYTMITALIEFIYVGIRLDDGVPESGAGMLLALERQEREDREARVKEITSFPGSKRPFLH